MKEICNNSKPEGMSDLCWQKFHKLLAKANIKYRREIADARAKVKLQQQTS